MSSVPCSPGQMIAEVASAAESQGRREESAARVAPRGGAATTIVTDPVRLRQADESGRQRRQVYRPGAVRIRGDLSKWPAERDFASKSSTAASASPPTGSMTFSPRSYRSTTPSPVQYGGTGLGLAISRHIAAALGGQITSAVNWGRARRFRSTSTLVPFRPTGCSVAVRRGPPRTLARPSNQALKLHGATSCWVEDGETNRKLLGLVLRRAGMHVVEAENGRRRAGGLERAFRPHPDGHANAAGRWLLGRLPAAATGTNAARSSRSPRTP